MITGSSSVSESEYVDLSSIVGLECFFELSPSIRLEKLAFRLLVLGVADDREFVFPLLGFECGGISTGEVGTKVCDNPH